MTAIVGTSKEALRRRIRISAWLRREQLTSRQLEMASDTARQAMTAIKAGRDVRLTTMVKILHGARVLTKRRVTIDELFDFDAPSDDTNFGAG